MLGYRDNPYHNRVHAFDVTQTCNFFVKRCKFQSISELKPLEVGSMYLAASIHDFEHP